MRMVSSSRVADRDERSARIAIAMKRFELIGWVLWQLNVLCVWFISFFVIAAEYRLLIILNDVNFFYVYGLDRLFLPYRF
jgi:hypothetical protein